MKPLLGAPLLLLSALMLAMGVGVLIRWRVRTWIRICGGLALVLPGLAGAWERVVATHLGVYARPLPGVNPRKE